MQRSYIDLLIEAEKMRTILLSLKELSTQSDGIMVNGEIISWDKAIPLIRMFPDFNATQNQKEQWMSVAAADWDNKYQEQVKNLVARRISENSSLETDNLYLWSLLNATDHIMSRMLDHADKKTFIKEDYNTLSAAKDLLIGLRAVKEGSRVTARIRNEIFISGIDNVFMEFTMLYTRAKNEGREKDAEQYTSILDTIRRLKTEVVQELGK